MLTPRRRTTSSAVSTPSRTVALPPLVLPAYPVAPFFDPRYLEAQEDDKASIDFTLSTTKDTLHALSRELTQILDALHDERAALVSEGKGFNKNAGELTRLLEEEKRALEDATRKREEVARAKREVEGKTVDVRHEITEVTEQLKGRRAKKSVQQGELSKQAARNTPEISFFEERIGLKMRGKGRDRVQFKFANLDPASFVRTFSFDLDASLPSYSVPSTTPPSFLPQPVLDALLDDLNTSRDFYGFVKEMRKAFKEEIGMEKMGDKERREHEEALGRRKA